ncbi:MAG: alpha/beta hydrolase [Caulobacterales bacterium]|nr:alpha/beta hydrolase [Caulobacterales bacterium]
MDRRGVIASGLAAAVATSTRAQTVQQTAGMAPTDPRDVTMLWHARMPGGESLPPVRYSLREPPSLPVDRTIDQVGIPQMDVFRPAVPDGSALIIAPGGGYRRQALDLEGMDIARRFSAVGVTCFVLRYRLPGEGWAQRSDAPLQDAQRAMRLVRFGAKSYGVDPQRIGFMGFSAGGHLAASIATRFSAPVYAPVDEADRVSARPDFSVPMYPVITMGPGAHEGSRDLLLGPNATPALVDAYSIERHITSDTPPTFIALAADDTTVPPVQNGIAYYTALLAAKVPAELHVFEAGGHGFGLAKTIGRPTAAWPDLLLRWGAARGYFKSAGRA